MRQASRLVQCILCERRITPHEAVWIADDDSPLDTLNHPVSILPMCVDCHLEIEMIADSTRYQYVRSISRLN